MPISTFSVGLQNAVAFLPGTHGTALLRMHTLSGALEEMALQGAPAEVINALKSSADCNVSFFGNTVPTSVSYLVLIASVILLMGVYILIHRLTINKK